jgi:type II secretory pathway pseudopilin PulG
LIELLVVVAIIAVLIAMLMPSLGKARQQAKLLTCANQMRQLGIALSAYAFENSDKYPPANCFNFPYLRYGCKNAGDRSFMGNLLLSYVGKKYDMFYCPAADPFTFSTTCRTQIFSSPNNNSYFIYGPGGEPGYDICIGYMYFGNYPQDGASWDGKWRYPTGPNSERMKVMQDMTSVEDIGYCVSHVKPASLYTDGSVISRPIEQLKEDGYPRPGGVRIFYID